MTELMRPALYDAFHRIEPVRQAADQRRQYEIVGPVCESSDVVGRDRELPPLAVGDLVAIRDAGAYGPRWRRTTTAGRFRSRSWWTTDGGASIRRRQTVDDLLALERE